jgi:bifunctional NMN adenylyltransferase/nudix hydrolase
MPLMNTGLIIGRFQPVHRYHIENLFLPALKEMDMVLVLIGSQLKARNIKNPFSYESVMKMIISAILEIDPNAETHKIIFEQIRDFPYSDSDWKFNVQKTVAKHVNSNITIFGVNKDQSTFYLDFFPEWDSYYSNNMLNKDTVDYQNNCASIIRNAWLEDDLSSLDNNPLLLSSVKGFLFENSKTKEHQILRKEYSFIKKYKQQFAGLPYPPIFTTVDNVVEWKDNILLIRRKSYPGKGLWALPGGFLDSKETLINAAYRELSEETNIMIYLNGSAKKLKFSFDWLQSKNVFDAPERSLRGRTITHAFYWKIPSHYDVKITPGSDASNAKWVSIHDVLEKMHYDMYEDHQDIISIMLLNKKTK